MMKLTNEERKKDERPIHGPLGLSFAALWSDMNALHESCFVLFWAMGEAPTMCGSMIYS